MSKLSTSRRLLPALMVVGFAAAPAAKAADRLIVTYEPGVAAVQRADARADAGVESLKPLLGPRAQVVMAGAGEAQVARRELLGDPRVQAVEVDLRVTVAATAPNDPSFGLLWGLRNTGQTVRGRVGTAGEDIGLLSAWDRTRGNGALVAVLDTGSDLAIGDVGANAWSNPDEVAGNGLDDDLNGKVDDVRGWSFVSRSANVADDHGHGTHVAGTILAAADNGSGVAGVAPEARLMTVKVLDADGSGWTSDIADGFEYAASEGAQVVNASLGGGGASSYLRNAIARHPGTLLVAAAGNEAVDVDATPAYPCVYPLENVVCVAAHTNSGGPASFSNWGKAGVDLAAPGQDVVSWRPGGSLAYMSGTSMATPHVAGAAALATAVAPAATPSELRTALIASARGSAALSGTSVSGGALDAAALLDRFPDVSATPPAASPTPAASPPPVATPPTETLPADPAPPTDPAPAPAPPAEPAPAPVAPADPAPAPVPPAEDAPADETPVVREPDVGSPDGDVTAPAPRAQPRIFLRSAHRRVVGGRPVLALSGRSTHAGRLAVRVCRSGSGRACAQRTIEIAGGRWTARVPLAVALRRGHLSLQLRLAPRLPRAGAVMLRLAL